jgi:hypothetical protein
VEVAEGERAHVSRRSQVENVLAFDHCIAIPFHALNWNSPFRPESSAAMAAQKRSSEDIPPSRKSKKAKVEVTPTQPPVTLKATEDVDFPRGGGTSFTPLEMQGIRAEAVKEANDELFKVVSSDRSKHIDFSWVFRKRKLTRRRGPRGPSGSGLLRAEKISLQKRRNQKQSMLALSISTTRSVGPEVATIIVF